jgi:alginate export protein
VNQTPSEQSTNVSGCKAWVFPPNLKAKAQINRLGSGSSRLFTLIAQSKAWLCELSQVPASGWLPGILLALAFTIPSLGAVPPCPVPSYKYLRYDEDYSYLANGECHTDRWDSLKFIALNAQRTWFLSLGAEVRENMEYFANPTWGQEPQGSPYLLQRYMFHADFHPGERLRFFVQVKSGLENGRAGGPRIIDEDKLDLQQASMEIELSSSKKFPTSLRIGRQEVALGSRRFVSAREGPTVRLSFDGFRVNLLADGWKSSVFLLRPVLTKPGFFDDSPAPGQTFWGVYTSKPLAASPGLNLDLYYLGLDRTTAHFQQGTASETRHSLGSRLWGQRHQWDFDLEPILQFGTFGTGNIRAWSFESETGYTISARTTPRLGLRVDSASGDSDPNNADLGTFNPLFPRGQYHQLVNLNGHVNFFSVDPIVVTHVREDLSLTFDWGLFWRESTADGVYGVGGNLLRPGSPQDHRYIGSQPSMVAEWHPQRHVTVIGIYTHSFPGAFLRDTGPARPVNYISLWLDYKF